MGKFNDRVGEIRKNNQSALMKIIEYNGCMDIKVEFIETGFIIKAQYSNFKSGKVKDPLTPSVCGIGYIGIGKFKPIINRKMTIEYKTWQHMLERCYDPNCINKNKNSAYQDITVCKEWHNFQIFAQWHVDNWSKEVLDEIMNFDKDIIKRGNKIYGPEVCAFVPQPINNLLIKSDKSRGKCLIGVSFRNNQYESKLAINGKRKFLGRYDTDLEAFNAYKIAKEEHIKNKANEYKEYIPTQIYDALMNYEVLKTD